MAAFSRHIDEAVRSDIPELGGHMTLLRGNSLRSLPLAVALILGAAAADAKSPAIGAGLAGCGGDALAAYVGKPVEGLRQRSLTNVQFLCKEDCAVIADFRASRLTVVFSKRTGLILKMYCG
jgi:hypothetical protein